MPLTLVTVLNTTHSHPVLYNYCTLSTSLTVILLGTYGIIIAEAAAVHRHNMRAAGGPHKLTGTF